MERLTDKNDVGSYFYPKCFEKCDGLGASSKCDNCEIMTSACEKLGKYEDLEEQGRLVKLPCKVGDTVYYISEGFIEPCTVETIFISDYTDKDGNCSYIAEIHYDREDCPYVSTEIYFTDIGKTVFLTQAEAERKLKEMESELYVSTSDFI